MNKRHLFLFVSLALMTGCSDQSKSKSTDIPNDPCSACINEQVCKDNVCYNPSDVPVDPTDPCSACVNGQICKNDKCIDIDNPTPASCDKCDPKNEECVDGQCQPKHPSDDPCTYCKEDEICINKACQTKTDEACDPPCEQGRTCNNGQCAICIGNNCYIEPEENTCQTNSECPDGMRCFEETCQVVIPDGCDPACDDGKICVDGQCQDNALLWSLCRSGSDCGVGECIFTVTPSRQIRMVINGETVEYSTNDPIPVSVLDERINPQNYNLTHTSKADTDDDIGICSFDCTKEENKDCPTGWACQVVAKGILDYPADAELPFELKDSDINQTPFAALCRRVITEEIQKDFSYGIELCNDDESSCKAAGMIFHDGMCLEPCNLDSDKCPYFFSCESVDSDSGSVMACLPNSGTCTGCYDHDKDGAGYGHCENKGIDCDDDNPNAYYQRPLSCGDIVDDNQTEIQTDLNCNGIIDKFELLGTLDNCGRCGDTCATPKSSKITVSCTPLDAENYDINWRNTATFQSRAPKFTCIEQCSFGYGDCKGNASCDVELLNASARNAAKEAIEGSKPVWIAASDLTQGKIYALDEDGDGYPTIDVSNTQSPDAPEERKLILDSFNSVICCADNDKYCYTANQDWLSLPLEATQRQTMNKNGERAKPSYVAPAKGNAADAYDINDKDPRINPAAAEICDGKDNDGSTLLARETSVPCSIWCNLRNENNQLLHETECQSFSTTVGNVTVYTINAYCDVTEDGRNEPFGWTDIVENKNHSYSEACYKRSERGTICNTGKVTCEANPQVACIAGSPNCGCGIKDGKAFRISEANTTVHEDGTETYDPQSQDFVKFVATSGGLNVTNCLCNGTQCVGRDCDGKDSDECFVACNKSCTLRSDYALACTVGEESSTVDGIVNNEPFFDGIDDDCDGRIDEDAMIPCIITKNAPYGDIKDGVEASAYKVFKNSQGYRLIGTPENPLAENKDGSVNLCRIGILQSKKVVVEDVMKYVPICVPLYQPRSYDFYGDAFDSNCDGADYDIQHTVFVTNSEQGDKMGSDSATCRYHNFSPNGFITPCASLQKALERAANRDAKQNVIFYDDIIMRGSSKPFTIDSTTVENDISFAVKLPTMTQQEAKPSYFYFPSSDLPDEKGHLKDGHIISPYKLHSLLVDSKRKNSSFDPNIYYFSYEALVTETHLVNGQIVTTDVYKPVISLSEQSQPAEVIRIYGGFDRVQNVVTDLPSEYDLWVYKDNATTTIDWAWKLDTIVNGKYKFTPTDIYEFMHPSSLSPVSLKMDSMTINVKPEGVLTDKQVNGATFIGINAMVGAKVINLNKVELAVTAPKGYSYDTAPTSKAVAGKDGRDSWRKEGEAGADGSYNTEYSNNTCQTHSLTCGSGINGTIPQPWGGCGGFAWTCKQSVDGVKHNGRNGEGSGDNGGTCSSMGGGDDWNCPKLKDYSSAQGRNGNGGEPGKNGDSDTTIASMKFDLKVTGSTPYSLYVSSDRSNAKGHYGSPGGGGGGGAVYQCWSGNGSGETRCYAASGGMGGCGGEGGLAGGTGGSALGIAVRSTSNVSGSTRIILSNGSKVTTTNGDGGKPQPGAEGALGGGGGYWSAYARCSGTELVCSDTQAQGMGGGGSGGGGGAGGDGGGGVAGWTYPFVFTCNNSNVHSFNDITLATLGNCGYDLDKEFIANAGSRGTQNTKGTRFNDIVYSSESISAKSGKQADAITDFDGKFRMGPSLRWSKSSTDTDQNCGGKADYRTSGGAGGTSIRITSIDTTRDTSCLRKETGDAVIIKAIKE